MPILLLLVPVVSTLAGGLLALRLRRMTPVLAAVSAGLLIGATFLDLLPEAMQIGLPAGILPARVLLLTLVSFLLFFVLENVLDSARQTSTYAPQNTMGRIAGAMLIFHSFRDGMAIGASYAASPAAGYAVALGIAAHDIGDGMNTVMFTNTGTRSRRETYLFLAADALAPLLGGLLGVWWSSSARSSVLLLALAAGFFLQMATSDLLPEVRRGQAPRRYIVPAVLCGAATLYLANVLLGHMQ